VQREPGEQLEERAGMSDTNRPGVVPVANDTGKPGNGQDVTRLRDLSPQQWKSGIAAWLGWLFDGLDMHLYTLVALPFVTLLLGLSDQKHPDVGYYSSVIQASFLVGWALGGGFFGRLGDRLGRARALNLTILTYALFTGLSFFAQTWWQLLICRFLAALGIGGEWAVGASLLSETWPRKWRPWIAAVLQSAVNTGVLLAMLAGQLLLVFCNLENRYVFLVGILPALLVVWIRRAVPEPEEWHRAKANAQHDVPGIVDLFRGETRKITVLTILVCALSLTAHWAFMYWFLQHLRNLPELADWTEPAKTNLALQAMILVMISSIAGNFLAAWIARRIGYRRAIAVMCVAYCGSMLMAYGVERPYSMLFGWYVAIGVCQGLFGLFTMYLPPLFPTLLRTTGAGFCYNIGRIVAAGGTVFFGLFSKVGDHRLALLYSGWLFLPAALVALLLWEPPDEKGPVEPIE
jgi:MFS family permease